MIVSSNFIETNALFVSAVHQHIRMFASRPLFWAS